MIPDSQDNSGRLANGKGHDFLAMARRISEAIGAEFFFTGEPFEQAVCDAGIQRLRPVMITVAATVLALFPLATHGGPLWQPLCYAQIGGSGRGDIHHVVVGAGLL